MFTIYLQKNRQEIQNSRVLTYFGAALAISHLLTFFYWMRGGNLLLKYLRDPFRICWPLFPKCYAFDISSDWMVHTILGFYAALAVINTLLFLINRWSRLAYFLSAILFFFKLAVFLQDYRFMGNYHYMLFWAQFAYLFLPNKTQTIMLLIPLFYFFAGSLKFNVEWLSSATFIRPVPLPVKLVEWLCAYVPILEMLLVWGLISKNRFIFGMTFLQFVGFHSFSYLVVGFFYPGIMACLLSLYLLARRLDIHAIYDHLHFLKLPRSSQAFLVIFALIQFTPYLYAGDPTLTAQGRMLSLNMLDAKSQCDDFIFLKYRNGVITEAPRLSRSVGVRLNCDPLVIFAEAYRYCRSEEAQTDFVDLDLGLAAKRTTDESYQQIFAIRNFCQSKPWIDVLGGIHL